MNGDKLPKEVHLVSQGAVLVGNVQALTCAWLVLVLWQF